MNRFPRRASDESSLDMFQGMKSADTDQLRKYDPDRHIAKKEVSREKWAKNLIHIIPIVVILCFIILWIFSRPVNVPSKGDSAFAPGVEGLMINNGSCDMQTGSTDDCFEWGD